MVVKAFGVLGTITGSGDKVTVSVVLEQIGWSLAEASTGLGEQIQPCGMPSVLLRAPITDPDSP